MHKDLSSARDREIQRSGGTYWLMPEPVILVRQLYVSYLMVFEPAEVVVRITI